MQKDNLLAFEASGCRRTAVNHLTLAPGVSIPLSNGPEERLLYFLDGRGIISIYEPAPDGDVYEARQDVSIYLTPGIDHEIINVGASPLRYVEFLIAGGVVPDDGLAWSAVSQRGATVAEPAAGSGVAITHVFDEGRNPSKEEGQHLRIRDVWLRRPQKLVNAEVLTIAPGRATRLHTHHDTSETMYVLYGEGHCVWDDREIPCGPGSVVSYPIGVQRKVVNSGCFPMSYVLIAALID
jgi:mannose-6-phosphate isomerase-like protein (cupin superfamily)